MPPTLSFPLVALGGQSPVRKRAEVKLELRTRTGAWVAFDFRVDSGAELCLMSAARAESPSTANPLGRDLVTTAVPRTVNRRLADGTTRTVTVGFGTITARFPQLPRFVFTWECVFDPTLPPSAIPLLGLGGRVLSDLRLTFEGPSPTSATGTLFAELFVSPVPLFPPAV